MIKKAARIILTLGISVLATVFLGGGIMASPASAATTSEITQHYNGELLPWDKETWNGATSCAVVSETDVYCFDTLAELDAFTPDADTGGDEAEASTSAVLYSCSGVTQLRGTTPNGEFRNLQFHDWGYWQNLSQWVSLPFSVQVWDNHPNGCKAYFRWAGGSCEYIAPNTEITFLPPQWADQVYVQNPSYAPAPGC
ncbi:hypothetical protein [Parafrankia elaeagni]|uniref:hypothetical protein n=1 Tax=Parafrankia elaeagni TaxID=222534 RepID=UPI0003767FB3|nr:hypothetical protein [Parafrankia elaeagni]